MTSDQLAELIERRTDALREVVADVGRQVAVLISGVADVRTDLGIHAVRLDRIEANGVERKAAVDRRRAWLVSATRDIAIALVGAALACAVKGCSP